MGFTRPQYHNGSIFETKEGDYVPEPTEDTTRVEDGFLARLSADGFLDCAKWMGPFKTKKAAEQAIFNEFDVCPGCGEDISAIVINEVTIIPRSTTCPVCGRELESFLS